MFKNQKGITLIALVITIIVLLILAGVSIAMLTGENGLLTRAGEAKTTTEQAEAAERINLNLNAIRATVSAFQAKGDKAYTGVEGTTGSETLKKDIEDVIKGDFVGITNSATPADGEYSYNLAGNKLSIYYKNDVSEINISGTITLDGKNMNIDKAPKSTT